MTTSPTAPNKTGWLAWLDDNAEKPFLCIGLLAIILIITFQTAYRYLIVNFSDTASAAVWTEELSRFIFIWISYLAVPLAIKNRDNIRVNILYDKFNAKWQSIFWVVNDLCFLFLSIYVTCLGVHMIGEGMRYPQMAPAMQIPYYIPYTIIPLGFALISFRLFQDIYRELKTCGLKGLVTALVVTAIIIAPAYILWYLPDFQAFENFEPSATIVLFSYFLLVIAIGVPIGIGLGLASLLTILATGTIDLGYIAQISFTSIDSFPIMAIPFFVAAGIFMGAGGLSTRLLNLADEMLGALPGGMAMASVATCMFFAAISGSGPATVAAIGSLTIPAMIQRGYNTYFACAIVAAGGAIGVMIPPSNPFVIYGIASQTSIGDLFLAGIIPGVLTGLVLMGYSYFVSKKNGWMGERKTRTVGTFVKAIWDAKLALMVPVIVLGGIYSGLMTPTEAAAVAAFYGLIVGMFVYKGLNRKNIIPTMLDICSTSAIIIILMAMAKVFGQIMTVEEIPAQIASYILGLTNSKIMILLLFNVFLLFIGTFMEALAAIVILVPILLPIATQVGIDPTHFGIIMVVNLAIGFITPPVGVNLFVASGVAKVKLDDISKQIWPILGLMILVLLLVTYIPEISMFVIR
jgi:C4-dicarboxylate transporter DctM subunit